MNRLLWLIVIIFLLGCEPSLPLNHSIKMTFGHTNLSIPSKYILPPLSSSLIPTEEMDKDSGGILLRIPLKDFGYNAGTGVGFRNFIHSSITPLNAHYSPNIPIPSLWAWNGIKGYKNRIIEFDKAVQLYRVYGSEYKRLWQYFKSYPSPSLNKSPVEEWVAGCSLSFTTTDVSDFSSVTCDTMFLHKGMYIKMTFSGEYLHLVSEFEQRMKILLDSWEI